MKFKEFKHEPVEPDTYEASMALNQLMRIGKHAIKLHNMIDDAAEMESWVAKKIDLAGDYVKKVYNYTEGEKAGLYDDGGMTEERTPQEKLAIMSKIEKIKKQSKDLAGDKDKDLIDKNKKILATLTKMLHEDAGDQDDWTKLLNAVAQRYGKEKARVIHDYAQHGTDSGRELMRDYGLTPGDGWWEDQPKWFKKFPWLEKLDKTSWMSRLVDIAGEGPEYGGAGYEYPKGLESVSEDEDEKTVIHSITPGSEKEKGMMQATIYQGGKRTDVLAATPKDLADQYIKNGVNYNDFNFMHTSDVDFPEEDDGWNNEKYGNDAHGFIQDALKILKNYKGESLEARLEAKLSEVADKQDMAKEIAKMYDAAYEYINDSSDNPSDIESDYKFGYNDDDSMEAEDLAAAFRQDYDRGMALQKQLQAQREKEGREGDWDPFNPESMYHAELKALMSNAKGESVSEDAGEGHMSKSTLYHTAKYAIALMQMIKPGDDLEGWVQSKLNKAADYLQGVYNYEEYQKLNPYREELDSNVLQKHAQVVQKNIDEILSKETSLDDIDTKPGMMRILAKRVNEVEKEIAKETRKQNEGKMSDIDADMKNMSDDDFMKKYKKSKEQMKKDLNEDGHMDIPSAIRNCETIMEDAMQIKQKLQTMEGELPSWMTQMIAVAASDLNDARDYLVNPTTESGIMYRAGVKKYGKKGMTAIQSAAGKGASHQEIGKIKDKYLKDEELDEGLKDWAKGLAAAGVIVGAVAGMGSINNAIDNRVPAVKALNNAYELAMDQGHTELATNIKQDLSAVKVRLQSGKDLDFVKSMQDKYSKFVDAGGLPYDIDTESKAYESKLAFMLNQQLK